MLGIDHIPLYRYIPDFLGIEHYPVEEMAGSYLREPDPPLVTSIFFPIDVQ